MYPIARYAHARGRELSVIDQKHPLIKRLVAEGYKISYHEHLVGSQIVVSFMACRKEPKQTITGRCRLGSPVKALEDLGRRVLAQEKEPGDLTAGLPWLHRVV